MGSLLNSYNPIVPAGPLGHAVTEAPAAPYYSAHATGLDDVFSRLWKGRAAIAISALLGTSLGLLLCSFQQRTYRSTALIEVGGTNDNLVNTRDVDPTVSSLNFGADSYLQTQIKIVESNTLLTKVIQRMQLEAHPELLRHEGLAARIYGAMRIAKPSRKVQMEDYIDWMKARLAIHIPAQTGMFEIAFEGPNPKIAADTVNAIVQEFIDNRVQARIQAGQATSAWLTQQIAELRNKVQRSEEAMQAYARSTGLLYTSEKDSIVEVQLRQLQEALSKAHEARVIQQSRYELLSTATPDSLPQVVDDQTVRDYSTRLTDLRRQLAEFRPVLAPGHYKIQQLQAQIAEVAGALDRKRQDVIGRIRNDFEAAQKQEKLLEDSYQAQSKLVREQSTKAVQYDVLKGELDANRLMYQSILQKVKEVGIASAMRASNISIVDSAKAARKPFRPNRNAYLSAGFGVGTLLGALLALVPPRRLRRADPPSIVARQLGLPELGSIPLVISRNGRSSIGTLRESKVSALTEPLRATMVSVLLTRDAGRSGHRPGVIVMTSCGRGEGRSTVSANLALAFTEAHHRVLLIDADVRNPHLARLLSLTDDRGLTDILSESRSIGSYGIEELAQPSEVPGLHLLAAGSAPAAAQGLLHSARMADLVWRVRNEFDVVIIDTAPVLTYSDARTLGKLSDGVAFVIRAGKTGPEDVWTAMLRLSEDGIPLLGTIANGRERSKVKGASEKPVRRRAARGALQSILEPDAE